MPCDKKKMSKSAMRSGAVKVSIKPDTTATKAKAYGGKQKGKKK